MIHALGKKIYRLDWQRRRELEENGMMGLPRPLPIASF
jgi:hypothetical protein